MTDKDEIIRALSLWFQPGDVFEIRILDAVTAEWMRPHMESGYFDFEHITLAAEAIGKLRGYRGAYVTINPVKPDLLARACNRIRGITKEPTTSDSDILERRWLPVDCDPVRTSGISSTDAEHEAAHEKAKTLREDLSFIGWPDPFVLDSGNGAQMLYSIKLPADDDGLVQRIIETLGKSSSDVVDVDRTVFNPARIWRIPGTMNCKGDSVPARPHRMAQILSVPEKITMVTEEQLQFVASETAETMEYEPQIGYSEKPDFDIDAWISKFAADVGQPVPYKGGRKWIFKVCPFNSAHTNNSAGIFQNADGTLGFRCHHNSCVGNDWKKFRVMREPGCYDQVTMEDELPAVNLDGIMNQRISPDDKSISEGNAEIYDEPVITLPPFPKTLFNISGFLYDVMKFCLDTAPSPQPELALAGAIALQAHLSGRKVEVIGGIRTNPYIVMLAPSGSGKNHPRRIIRRVLTKIGLGNEVIDDSGSGQGIEDRLIVTPTIIWEADEIYEMLQALIKDKSGTKEKMMKTLLTLQTSAADDVTTRIKTGIAGTIISCPNLTLFGACTTEGFFNSIDERIIGHGMFARMTLFPTDDQPEPQIPGNLRNIPSAIEHHALQWKNYRPVGTGNLDMEAKEILGSEEVMSKLREYQLEAYREKMKLQKAGEPDWQLSLWSRAYEGILRFALIYACSEAKSPEKTVLSLDGIQWARTLIHWDIQNKLAMVKKFFCKSDFECYTERVVSLLQRWHKAEGKNEPMPGWLFNRKIKELPPKVREAVIQSLKDQARIEVVENRTEGRPSTKYRLRY